MSKNDELMKKVSVTSVEASEKEKYNEIGSNMGDILKVENNINIPNPMIAMTVLEQGICCVLKHLAENRAKALNSADGAYSVKLGNYVEFGITHRPSEDEEKEGNYCMFANILPGAKLIGKSDEESEDE